MPEIIPDTFRKGDVGECYLSVFLDNLVQLSCIIEGKIDQAERLLVGCWSLDVLYGQRTAPDSDRHNITVTAVDKSMQGTEM